MIYRCEVCHQQFRAKPCQFRRYCSKKCYGTTIAGIPRSPAIVEKIMLHGHSRRSFTSPEYRSWASMKGRCSNPKLKEWKNYGGRGITVCDRWKSFVNFVLDMGYRPPGTTLDRRDNDGNYEPGNCRWATRVEQRRNMRPGKFHTLRAA